MKTHIFARRLAMTLLILFTSRMIWAASTEVVTVTLGNHTYVIDENNNLLIQNETDWDSLAAYVARGNNCAGLSFLMTNDLGKEDPVTSMIGVQATTSANTRRRFAGTFDGGHHILNVNLVSAETNPNYCAPFAYVQNTTIKNLHVTGLITASGQFGSGLIGSTGNSDKDGDCVIENCQVSVEILGMYETKNGRFPNHGGFIGVCEGNATITDCWFDGAMSGLDFQHCGGFIGLSKRTSTFNNCFFNPYKINISNKNYANAHEFANYVTGTCIYEDAFFAAPFGSDLHNNPQGQQVYNREIEGCEHGVVTTVSGHNFITNTIHINVKGYGENKGGWVFISNPMEGKVTPQTLDINHQTDDYDLYRFNQSGANGEWENYKAHTNGFVIENGRGYLFASKKDVTLAITSGFNTDDSKTVDLAYNSNADAKGWNLVGNPFTVDAWIDKSYYVMNARGTALVAEPVSASTPIKPCQGVMVHATGKNQKVTFSTQNPEMATSNHDNQGNLSIALSQANSREALLDKAIVSFNESDELTKYYFGESDANIYLPKNGEEYVIASAEKSGEMPVNFKAYKNGTYTLTVSSTLTAQFSALHLIDHLTGADVDLLATPSYTFNGKVTDYETRFMLVFNANTNVNENENGNEIFAFRDATGNLIVNGTGTLQIFDIQGRAISVEELTSRNSQRSTLNLNAGVYVLKLTEGTETRIQKIVIE